MPLDRAALVPALKNIATRLRIDSVQSTSEAGTGHPTTCCSAAELVAALFFAEMRFDPQDPQHPESDRFVLSKGHAAPLLYAAWAEAGAFDARICSICGQITIRPRRPSDAAAAVRGRRDRIARPGHLRGDWHRAQRAPHRVGLPHVCAPRRRRVRRRLGVGSGGRRRRSDASTTSARITDMNAFGQSQPTHVASRHGRSSRGAGARSAGTPSPSTVTTWPRSSARSPRPARRRASRR